MAGAKEGGAENIMLESVLALAQAGVEQAVVTRPDNEFRIRKFRDAGIRAETANFNRLWPFPTSAAIAKVMKEFKPDVAEYWMGRAGQFAPASFRSRSIAWYGGYYKLARFANCEWHVGLTRDLLRHIREQGVPDNRSAIIHTYADFEGVPAADRAALNTPADAPVALALARLHWKKGLDTLLDADRQGSGPLCLDRRRGSDRGGSQGAVHEAGAGRSRALPWLAQRSRRAAGGVHPCRLPFPL